MAHEEPSAHLADPETDPLATYVLEPDDLRTLCARVVTHGPAGVATTYAPFTGAPIAAVPVTAPDDAADAARAARAAHRRWATVPRARRRAVLLAAGDLLLSRQSDVLDLVQVETGLARATASAELVAVADLARALAVGDPARPRRRLDAGQVRRRPAGVVAVLGAGRAPVASTLGAALAPLLTGNAVLLHPDPQAVLVALWVAELLEDAGLPAQVLQVLTGGTEVGAALIGVVDRLLVPATAAGRELAVLAGHLQVPVNRLTNGTVAAYVPAHAPVAPTAVVLAGRCFDGSPQAVRRVVVHRDVAEAFEEAFVEATEALVAGAGLDYRAEVGSLSDAEQLQQVGDLVAEAAGMGARVLTGAEPLLACGPLFYAPTVLADVPTDAGARDVPTAGPLVVLEQVASDDEAVAAMNATGPMPLALLCATGAGVRVPGAPASGVRALDVRADVIATGRPGALPVRPDLGALVDHVTDVQVVRGAGAPAVLGEIACALRADLVGRVLRAGRGTRPTS